MNENVFIHLQPTLEEVRRVYCELNEYGDLRLMPPQLRSYIGWMDYFQPRGRRDIAFCPVVIEIDGRFPVIIWMTDYCADSRSAQIHFAAHGRYRLKTVFGTARLAVNMILGSREIDLLQAFYTPDNRRAAHAAAEMGFRIYARTARCVYSFAARRGTMNSNGGLNGQEQEAEEDRTGG